MLFIGFDDVALLWLRFAKTFGISFIRKYTFSLREK